MNANIPMKSEEASQSSGKFGLHDTKHLDTIWKSADILSVQFSV